MLYIVTALYEEALPFIKIYCLKRKLDFPHFELFGGEEVLLLITRPGALRAATALSSLLTAFPPDKHDLLLSVGCAGCALPETLGKAFLICRITEKASMRTRYPELIYRCPFPEAQVVTLPSVCKNMEDIKDMENSMYTDNTPYPIKPLPLLYDMEAAGVYEAAIPYFSCDRLLFIKVVSDALTGLLELDNAKRRLRITEYISDITKALADWVGSLICSPCMEKELINEKTTSSPSCQPSPNIKNMLGTEGLMFFYQVCEALRLSSASSQQLYQLMLYLTLSKIPYMDSMKELLSLPLSKPCREKKEGLKYLEQLNRYYL